MSNNETFEIECSDEEDYFDPETVYRQVNGKRIWEPKGDVISELYSRLESNGGTFQETDFDWQNPGRISPSQLKESIKKSENETDLSIEGDADTEKDKKTEFDFDNDFDDEPNTLDSNSKVTVKSRTSQGKFILKHLKFFYEFFRFFYSSQKIHHRFVRSDAEHKKISTTITFHITFHRRSQTTHPEQEYDFVIVFDTKSLCFVVLLCHLSIFHIFSIPQLAQIHSFPSLHHAFFHFSWHSLNTFHLEFAVLNSARCLHDSPAQKKPGFSGSSSSRSLSPSPLDCANFRCLYFVQTFCHSTLQRTERVFPLFWCLFLGFFNPIHSLASIVECYCFVYRNHRNDILTSLAHSYV